VPGQRERDLRCLRQRLSRTRPYRVLLRQSLQIDAQPADIAEDEASDNIDEDYQPIPRYRSPRPPDHEAGGSGSASRSDPAMVAILERLT
jgi:hypothetical protein